MERKIEFETWTFIDLVLTDIQKLICGYLILGGALAISSSNGLPDKFFKNHYFEQNNGIVVTLVFFVLMFYVLMNLICSVLNLIIKEELFILFILEVVLLFVFPTKIIASIFTNIPALVIVWFISRVLQRFYISKKAQKTNYYTELPLMKSEHKKDDPDNR